MFLSKAIFPALICMVLFAIWDSERIVSPRTDNGRVHVVYWEKWTDTEQVAIQSVVDAFNSSQDKIHVDMLSIGDVGSKTLLAVAGGEPPDIAGLWGENIAQYADDHAVLPLEELCAEYGINEDRFIPVYWQMCNYNGHVYALPSAPHSTALHYNRTLFANAGLDPDKPPKTIEEMDSMAEHMTKSDAQGHIDVLGFLPAEPGDWGWGLGNIFGGKLWDGKSKITANSPENIRAYTWVASYSKKYGAQQLRSFRGGYGNDVTPQNAFMASKLGMELNGVWMSNYIHVAAPKLKWSAAPFPYPADRPDMANINYTNQDVFVIPRGAKHPKEAFAFLNFAESQKGMELLCMGQGKHTPLKNVSAGFWKNHPNPYIHLFTDLAYSKNDVTPPKMGIWPEYLAEMNNAFDQISLLQKTPKEALDIVQERMTEKWTEHLERLRARGEIH